MRYLLFFLLLSSPAIATTCPALPDRNEERAALMKAVRLAKNETANRIAVGELWRHWLAAPDAKAQELLDLGMQLRREFRLLSSAEILSELIAYCPDYAEGWNQRAFAYFLHKDYELALQDLEKALEIRPDHIAAMSGKALTLQKMGREEEAEDVLKRALVLNPYLPEKRLLPKPKGIEL